jgi:hypothetical protein
VIKHVGLLSVDSKLVVFEARAFSNVTKRAANRSETQAHHFSRSDFPVVSRPRMTSKSPIIGEVDHGRAIDGRFIVKLHAGRRMRLSDVEGC